MSLDVINSDGDVEVIRVADGGVDLVSAGGVEVVAPPEGPRGRDARVIGGFFVNGPFAARALICAVPMVGAGVLSAASSRAEALVPAAAPVAWSVTRNGDFADALQATDAEVAAALFATIAFPAGPGAASWTYAGGGVYADGDLLRVWEAAAPDIDLAYATVLFAGD
jgi:hypothetical protein